jgi:multidrug resistance protein, MATE family
VVYIASNVEYRQYSIRFFCRGCWSLARNIFSLSWPVMFEKAAQQAEKLWISRCIAPLGVYALSSLNVIIDIEKLAFIPAIALGQVITILASHDYGVGNYEGIKQTIKRCIFLALCMVMGLFVVFSLNAYGIIGLFDKEHTFTDFAAHAFSIVSILICIDTLQLVLAGALRGTSNVQVVMWVRVLGAIFLLAPLSYGISLLPISNTLVKFMLIYGSYNAVNMVSCAVYYYWFHSDRWRKNKLVCDKQVCDRKN